jgi:hypothetical protein
MAPKQVQSNQRSSGNVQGVKVSWKDNGTRGQGCLEGETTKGWARGFNKDEWWQGDGPKCCQIDLKVKVSQNGDEAMRKAKKEGMGWPRGQGRVCRGKQRRKGTHCVLQSPCFLSKPNTGIQEGRFEAIGGDPTGLKPREEPGGWINLPRPKTRDDRSSCGFEGSEQGRNGRRKPQRRFLPKSVTSES